MLATLNGGVNDVSVLMTVGEDEERAVNKSKISVNNEVWIPNQDTHHLRSTCRISSALIHVHLQ